MAYPKPYAPVTLKRYYQKLDLPQETVDLLHRYFTAMSHFYLAIPLEEAYRIITKQNPELNLSEEKFDDFATIARREVQPYRVSGIDEFYPKEEPTTGLQRWIAAEEICGRYQRDFRILEHESYSKPWFVPEKDELLRYEDPDYRKILPEESAFKRQLSKLGLNREEVDSFIRDLYVFVREPYYNGSALSNYLVWMMEENELDVQDLDEIQDYINGAMILVGNWPLPVNHGYTPTELFKLSDGKCHNITIGPNVRKAIAEGNVDPMNYLIEVLSLEGMTDEAMDQAIEQIEDMMSSGQRFKNRELLTALKNPGMRKVLLGKTTVEEAVANGELPPPSPIASSKKVGRNEPCPCGSGKKYKNCCGRPKRFS